MKEVMKELKDDYTTADVQFEIYSEDSAQFKLAVAEQKIRELRSEIELLQHETTTMYYGGYREGYDDGYAVGYALAYSPNNGYGF